MELNRLLLVFILCFVQRTVAFETKKLSQPLQRDILNLESEEPVRVSSESRIKHADEEEDEYDPINTIRSPPYLTNSGTEKEIQVQETETEDSVCLQPKKVGPCRGKLPRFYFNSKTKICEQFNYGGCKHNDNNFKTEEDCKDKCISNWERGYKELKILPSLVLHFFSLLKFLTVGYRKCNQFLLFLIAENLSHMPFLRYIFLFIKFIRVVRY